MRLTKWLGDAVLPCERHHDVCGGLEVIAVPRRDKHRVDPILRAEHDADLLLAIDDLRARAALARGIIISSREVILCTSDGWSIERPAEQASEAKAARVRPAMTIDHDDIGDRLELSERFEQAARFAQ